MAKDADPEDWAEPCELRVMLTAKEYALVSRQAASMNTSRAALVRAILRGVLERAEQTGQPPVRVSVEAL